MLKMKFILVMMMNCIIEYKGEDRCEYDPMWEPDSMTIPYLNFMWFGLLQYINIQAGTIYPFRMPRVTLINKNHVLLTARDAVEIPTGYALGNVVFPEYERDDDECGLVGVDIEKALNCEAVTVMIPVLDVFVHPEYPENPNSIALLRLITPIKSAMVLPVCLPYKEMLDIKSDPKAAYYSVDITNGVTRDYTREEKFLSLVTFLPYEACKSYANEMNISDVERLACTKNCNFHPGTAVVSRDAVGYYTLNAIATEKSFCADPLRRNRKPPSFFIKIFPYLDWIRPQLYTMPEVLNPILRSPHGYLGIERDRHKFEDKWIGHYREIGYCDVPIHDMDLIYMESFFVAPKTMELVYVNWDLYLETPKELNPTCLRIGIPFRKIVFNLTYRIYNVKLFLRSTLVRIKYEVKWTVLAFKFTDPDWYKPPTP